MNKQLERKTEQAIKLIQSAAKKANEAGQPLEICYSCGKDSEVILALAKMSGVNYRAIYKITSIDPAGTIKHATEKGVELVRPKETFLSSKDGYLFTRSWTSTIIIAASDNMIYVIIVKHGCLNIHQPHLTEFFDFCCFRLRRLPSQACPPFRTRIIIFLSMPTLYHIAEQLFWSFFTR